MNADAVAADLRAAAQRVVELDELLNRSDEDWPDDTEELEDKMADALDRLRAALAAAPLPSEPCPGCEICVGEIDDCGCVIGHEHTCAPLPSDTPADGPPSNGTDR